ncbi:MAG: hypothetical protein L3K01_02855 [Thermoplasmata archaeon]|nr:hypothetical protein [Thermoplasmata archaeon]
MVVERVHRRDVPWTRLVRPSNARTYLTVTGFTAVIAAPLLLFVSWSLLGRGSPRLGVLELDVVVAAIFAVVAVWMGSIGTNLGIELIDTGVVRYWTTGLSRDPVWRVEYPWESLSMPSQGLATTLFYSDDDPFQVARNQAKAIESDLRYRRKGNRPAADMRLHPGG